MEVIYEDNHVIVVSKTSSEIVQGDKTGDTPLSELVKQYLKEKYNKPGNVFVGVTHRLDRPVSGLVVFAKTSKALARLNDMFRNGEVKKTYWAIVKDCPPETARNRAQRRPSSTTSSSGTQTTITCSKWTCRRDAITRYAANSRRWAVPSRAT